MMRAATMHDVPSIMPAMVGMLGYSTAPHMAIASPIAAELGLRDHIHTGRAVIVGDFLVMFDVAKPWYSDANVLIETFVLRYKRDVGNSRADVAVALYELARQHNCTHVAAGDTQAGHMGQTYTQHGFKCMGMQYFKGLDDGMATQSNRGAESD